MIDYRTLLKKYMKAIMLTTGSANIPEVKRFLDASDVMELLSILKEVHKEVGVGPGNQSTGTF